MFLNLQKKCIEIQKNNRGNNGFKSNASAQEYANLILANLGFLLTMIEDNAGQDPRPTIQKKTVH